MHHVKSGVFGVMGCVGILAGGSLAEARVIRVPAQYATIQAAVNAAVPGDTVTVAPGTYKEVVTLKNRVQLHASYAGERKSQNVIIDARELKPVGIADYAVGSQEALNGVEVVGFTIINDGTGILVRGTGHLIAKNTIDVTYYGGFGREAIKLDGANQCVLQGNEIYGRIEYTFGVRLVNSSENILKDNIIEGSAYGVKISDGTKNKLEHNLLKAVGFPGVETVQLERSAQTVLRFNTIYASDAAGRAATALELVESPDVRVVNCILAGFAGPRGSSWGISSRGSSTVTVAYSDLWATYASAGPGVTIGAGVILKDPQFVDITDFRLLPSSPARDAGNGKDTNGTRADLGFYGGK